MADALQGMWLFNDTPEGFGDTESHRFTISFVSNGASYNSIDIQLLPSSPFAKDNWIYYDSERVYVDQVGDESGWQSEAYKTITITSKLSEVTNGGTLLAWLQANATKQAAPSPTYPKINSFTYHGKQIRNINGKPIRYVHDKRAGASNTYEMVYFTPSGDLLLDVNEVFLQDCDGNYLEYTAVTLISFTIAGRSYQAEEGMTWEEWVNSSYNTGGYEIVGAYITKRYTEASYFQVRLNNVAVVSSDKIEPNTSYTEIRQSGGGGSGN